MTVQDMVIEMLLDHGIARVQKGFGYTVELAGWVLDTDGETLFSGKLEETARKHGLSVEAMTKDIRAFSRYIQKKEPWFYRELTGELFQVQAFLEAVAEQALDHYRSKHTLLPKRRKGPGET